MSAADGIATPSAEVVIDEPLVRALLQANGIETRARTLATLDEGWDNALFDLGPAKGDDPLSARLVVRLPRRAMAVPLLEAEQHWVPKLPALPIPIPQPLFCGQPAAGYPWPFTLLPWLPGKASDLAPADDAQAPRYADFLAALHQPAPPEAPENMVRGVPLARRAEAFNDRWQRVAPDDVEARARLEQVWQDALAAPDATDRVWLHGDAHARNLLVDHGRISGVIDWGDLGAGDRATDMAAFWMHFHSAQARQSARSRYTQRCRGVRAADWLRARGWALMFAAILIDTGRVDHPRHLAMGERTLTNLLTDL